MAEHAKIEETEIEKAETNDDLKPTPQTIARTVIYFVTWINMLFAFFGMPQLVIDPDMLAMVLEGVYIIVSAIATFASSTRCWWMNNSFTKPAIEADNIMTELKEAWE